MGAAETVLGFLNAGASIAGSVSSVVTGKPIGGTYTTSYTPAPSYTAPSSGFGMGSDKLMLMGGLAVIALLVVAKR